MTIIYFFIILAALILVHEFGHFIVAKASGMRVDEFGLGFPPRVARLWKKGDTEYTLNLLPIGGFVKIHGENYDDISDPGAQDSERSFVNKPRHKQALVLSAGVTMNVVFAWVLLSLGFMLGLPAPVGYTDAADVQDPELTVVSVLPDSPADEAGVHGGEVITGLSSGEETLSTLTPEALGSFVTEYSDAELTLETKRGAAQRTYTLTPSSLESTSQNRPMLGIQMDMIGTLQLAPHRAVWEGFRTTGELINTVTVGLGNFVYRAFAGTADYSSVAGPVGIVDLVGTYSQLGYIYLLQFTAMISINLAIINLVPIPALDGGRLLFVAVESIKGSALNPKIANVANAIGFFLLILLMIAVTFNDILNLL